MKIVIVLLISIITQVTIIAQQKSSKTYIFIPHPRSEDKVKQSVLPVIEQINFTLFDMILLGGDITYYTSIDRTSMEYSDSLFHLSSPNTLWTLGNHDLDNPSLIEEYTGRPSYYCYTIDNITFVVLNTELDANDFVSSHISNNQLKMLQNVCDTISNSSYLVVLHHRLLWMIGDSYFENKIDSVGESTRQLDTSNFNTIVVPLLQKAKSQGVKVLCLGGDKSKINIEYSPEDSITYIASTMAPEFSNAENDVVILSLNTSDGQLNWEFVPLNEVEKNPPILSAIDTKFIRNQELIITSIPNEKAFDIYFNSSLKERKTIIVYSINGQKVYHDWVVANEHNTITVKEKGIYIVKTDSSTAITNQKIIVY